MKKLFVLLSFLTYSSVLFEPSIAYNLAGKGEGTGNYLNARVYEYSGPQFAASLGAQFLGLMGGFKINYSSFTLNTTDAIYKYSVGVKRTDFGVFAGYNLPILLRAWMAYYFSSSAEMGSTVVAGGNTKYTSGEKYKGSALEIGLGYTGIPIPLLSLNLIYRAHSITESSNGANITPYSGSAALKWHEILLGASAPITF